MARASVIFLLRRVKYPFFLFYYLHLSKGFFHWCIVIECICFNYSNTSESSEKAKYFQENIVTIKDFLKPFIKKMQTFDFILQASIKRDNRNLKTVLVLINYGPNDISFVKPHKILLNNQTIWILAGNGMKRGKCTCLF